VQTPALESLGVPFLPAILTLQSTAAPLTAADGLPTPGAEAIRNFVTPACRRSPFSVRPEGGLHARGTRMDLAWWSPSGFRQGGNANAEARAHLRLRGHGPGRACGACRRG